MVALQQLAKVAAHVVTQIVKAQFVVGGIGDIRIVADFFVGLVHAGNGDADGQAQRVIDLAHPCSVTAGEVIVHGHHMNAPAGERVQVDGQYGHEGFTLTGFHFRDIALMQENATHELNIERAQTQGAEGRLAGGGKCFG